MPPAGGGKKISVTVTCSTALPLSDRGGGQQGPLDGRLSVEKDVMVVDTCRPSFLGLDAPNGPRDQLGGPGSARTSSSASSTRASGQSSFHRTGANGNASKDGKLAISRFPAGTASAHPEAFNASLCNELIGAQHFNAAWGGNAAIAAQRPWVHVGPRLQRPRHAHLVDRGG